MDARFSERHQSAKVETFITTTKEGASEMEITTIGIDLAKMYFNHTVLMNAAMLSCVV